MFDLEMAAHISGSNAERRVGQLAGPELYQIPAHRREQPAPRPAEKLVLVEPRYDAAKLSLCLAQGQFESLRQEFGWKVVMPEGVPWLDNESSSQVPHSEPALDFDQAPTTSQLQEFLRTEQLKLFQLNSPIADAVPAGLASQTKAVAVYYQVEAGILRPSHIGIVAPDGLIESVVHRHSQLMMAHPPAKVPQEWGKVLGWYVAG